jgi:nicotinamide-nucleotide amidase
MLLSIGSELLAGETVDANAAFIGRELASLGIQLAEVRQLPDERDAIAKAFVHASVQADLVLATGGLGPTHDDLTRDGLAYALDEELTADPLLEAQLRERFGALGRMPESNLRQALRVPSAETLPNPIGSAPGWWVDRDGMVVALMPGVPSEMRRMFAEQVAPRLSRRFALRPLHVRTVKTFGIGESAVAEMVGDLLERPGPNVNAGIYARDDGVHLRFSTRADPQPLSELLERASGILGDAVWGLDHEDLGSVALAAIRSRGAATVASWEADTHGALLAILAAADEKPSVARYLGGVLDAGGAAPLPMADAVVQVSLLPEDAHGRSRVRVALIGSVSMPMREVRIHGSGEQRLRRAGYGALDQLRRLAQ